MLMAKQNEHLATEQEYLNGKSLTPEKDTTTERHTICNTTMPLVYPLDSYTLHTQGESGFCTHFRH